MASVVMPIGFKVRVLYTPHLLASLELPHGLGLWSLLNKFNLMIRGQRLTQRKSQLQAHRSLVFINDNDNDNRRYSCMHSCYALCISI